MKKIISGLAILIALNLSAQNTSIGHVQGTYKDTNVVYKEDPQKHVHQETIVISKEKDKDKTNAADKDASSSSSGQTPVAVSNENTQSNPAPETVTGSETTTETTTTTEVENMCSCSSLHWACGLAAISLLGFILFLGLYLKEKNKNRSAK